MALRGIAVQRSDSRLRSVGLPQGLISLPASPQCPELCFVLF